MYASLSALILALLAFLGPVRIALVPGAEVIARDFAHRTADNPEGAYGAIAKIRCEDASPEIQLTVRALDDPTALTHELLHAVDCVDNGVFDGSPDPTQCAEVPTDCAHSWVYWALRNREEAIALISRMTLPGPVSGVSMQNLAANVRGTLTSGSGPQAGRRPSGGRHSNFSRSVAFST